MWRSLKQGNTNPATLKGRAIALPKKSLYSGILLKHNFCFFIVPNASRFIGKENRYKLFDANNLQRALHQNTIHMIFKSESYLALSLNSYKIRFASFFSL